MLGNLTILKAGDIFIDDSVEGKKHRKISEFAEFAYIKLLILHIEVKANNGELPLNWLSLV